MGFSQHILNLFEQCCWLVVAVCSNC